MYILYIVRCADRTLYTGITTDIERRMHEHNTSPKGARYTRSRRPVTLVYSKRYRTRSTASRAEAAMKRMTRQEKIRMVRLSRKHLM
jgi:putative endonuclease